MNKTSLDAIIFDLGGVILEIDYERTVNAFKALGFDDFDRHYSQLKQSGLFDELECGRIDRSGFVDRIQEHIPERSSVEILDAWNAIILDYPLGRLDYVIGLRELLPVFLLSNTNEIHFEFFDRMLHNTSHGGIKQCFDKAYLSHEIGERKPNLGAFEIILNENNLSAGSTLFVDDSPQHIESAKRLGLQTIHLTSISDLEKELKPFLA
ncbi:MAG: HAD family phosphatase [Flavobacteriales bacterium]